MPSGRYAVAASPVKVLDVTARREDKAVDEGRWAVNLIFLDAAVNRCHSANCPAMWPQCDPSIVPRISPKHLRVMLSQEKAKSRKSLTYGSLRLARATGIEPATTGSTVRYSNQLSYAPNGSQTTYYNRGAPLRKSTKPIAAGLPPCHQSGHYQPPLLVSANRLPDRES